MPNNIEKALEDTEDISHEIALVDRLPTLNIQQLNSKSTDLECIDADAEVINFNLTGICLAWKAPRLTIEGACKLANTTAKLLETRRKLLNRQYGSKDDKSLGSSFTPID